MSNTLTNISSTMVQDEVLPALKLGLLPLNAFSLQVSDTPKNVGDIVNVPVVTAKSAAIYTSTFETGDTTTTSAAVTMLAPMASNWYVNPNLGALATVERFLAQGREAAYAVAKQVLEDVLDLCVANDIGDVAGTDKVVVTAANYDVDDQADCWSMLKTKGVASGISAIHTIAYAAALLKDQALQNVGASGMNVLQTGELSAPILGANQYYTDVFSSTLTSENTTVIYTGKETIAVALGVPNVLDPAAQSAAGVNQQIITDPDTGIPMVWRTWMNAATGAYWGSVHVMHGQKFLRNSAVRVVSA